jgi:uncharacterized YigZ family protein
MEKSDNYKSLAYESTALHKEKASKFYAYAFPVESEEEVSDHLKYLKKEHIKARHFCYSYILGIDRNKFRANDDGEPSGTAGKPIMGQLEKNELTNVLVVVVRYFGGTKLGVSGLIKAYKTAAALAIENNEVETKYLSSNVILNCDFELIGTLQNILSKLQIQIKSIKYENDVVVELEMRSSHIQENIKKIKSIILNRSIQDIQENTEVEGLRFEII